MLIKTILNRVHPIKGFVYTKIKLNEYPWEEIVATIEPRKNSKGRCSICGKTYPGYDRLPERRFAFIPLWNIRFSIAYRPRRVACKEHGVTVESFPWSRGKEHATLAFQTFLSQWAKLLSWKEVATRFQTSWDTVYNAIKRVVDYGLEHRDLTGIISLGVDEMAIGKGHDYITAVYQIDADNRRLLWVGKDRKVKTLLRFFVEFGKERSAAIRNICSDMWKPYLKVIAKKLPDALNILDRFHIMKKFNDALDKVRRNETARLLRDGYEPVLSKSRWLLLKRPENLTVKQRGHLKALVQYNLQSVRSYLLREDFQHFWTYKSVTWAEKFLDDWVRKTLLSKIDPMKKVAKMLRKHKPLIMNWFKVHGSLSSGVVEAMNNTAKLTIRKSYGFRQYETLKYALYHKLGALPLPEGTHKFF
jgi:transposase